ncbi:MAG: winged-helix domain-containing protein [Brevibacterium sp.]|uniref:winged helix-turn-helix domain-containing protein n=1 Tax=Brevibacterium sp. TaxID=1701 RepID=UPI0026473E0D|nr:winged-helix domain-containing protein [Brevibacterium sp.]MDN5806627.1 winged-helix domain-containing protein [Brevibacterium sp.]MDN6122750.1 winged-helix domain-containing protein [Brevibacterium sp.]MDN6156703.1 winged-helix domain-containing protein [Brevibacterium sp.]MDN6604526.1 winged-helix domain-containing protein [Brevibacterium sp.]
MEHMRILHICPASRIGSPLAPESLQYLGHQIQRLSIDGLQPADTDPITADIVIADACFDLSLAPAIAEAVAQAGITAPIIVVLSEGGLATASAKWHVFDIVLTTAGPAEVEARLRLARDHHRTNASYEGRQAAPGTWAVTDAASWHSSVPRTSEGEPTMVVSGALRIDESAFTAHLGERSLDLTYREFALLKFFAMHPERVFTRDEILRAVWGDDYYGGTRTVDVHVRRVRAKLGKDLENAIHTVRYVGYRFSPESAAARGDESESGAAHDDESESGAAHDDGPQSGGDEESEHEQPEAEPNEEDVKV